MKPNKLLITSAKFYPYAECLGAPGEPEDSCGWEMGASARTRDRAKDHAKNRLHQVRVVVEEVTIYRGEKAE